MPYISREDRHLIRSESIENLIADLSRITSSRRKGAVNYAISRVVLGAMEPQGYHGISDAVSVLRDAAAEIERRMMGPREDVAIEKNGDLPEYADLL